MTDLKIIQANDFYKSGDKKKARKLLAEVVRTEANSAMALYSLALCIDDPKR